MRTAPLSAPLHPPALPSQVGPGCISSDVLIRGTACVPPLDVIFCYLYFPLQTSPPAACNETVPFAGGHWKLDEKLYFNQRGARVSAADFHAPSGMLVVAFTNGIFDLYELPAFQNVHTLSVTRERISSAVFNATGNWVRTPTIPDC